MVNDLRLTLLAKNVLIWLTMVSNSLLFGQSDKHFFLAYGYSLLLMAFNGSIVLMIMRWGVVVHRYTPSNGVMVVMTPKWFVNGMVWHWIYHMIIADWVCNVNPGLINHGWLIRGVVLLQ